MDQKTQNIITNVWLILIIITLSTLINKDIFAAYSAIALYVNFLLAAFCMIISKKITLKFLLFITLLSTSSIISFCINNSGFGSVITFIVPILMFEYISYANFKKIHSNIIRTISALAIIILFRYSFSYSADYYNYAKTSINPNALGMFLMFSIMLYICFGNEKTLRSNFINTLLAIITVIAMYNLESRGTTMATVCFFLMCLYPGKFLPSKLFFMLVISVIIIGTLFPFMYLKFIENGDNIVVFGKNLHTGRQIIWTNMIEQFDNNPFFYRLIGLGSHTVVWNHALNIHNNYFNIIVNFGAIGFTLYYFFILSRIKKILLCWSNQRARKFLFMFVCSVLILGFTETTSLWPTIFVFAYIGIAVGYGEYRKTAQGCHL